MKITPKQYAQSLYQAACGKKQSDVKGVIENFVKVLINNNYIAKADQIIKQFKKIWNKEQGIVKAEVISARKLDIKITKLLNNYIAKLSGAKTIDLRQEVDKSILGGVVIKYEDKVLDGGLKTRLTDIKNKMIK